MLNLKRILTLIISITLIALIYLYYSFQIFNPPKIDLLGINPTGYKLQQDDQQSRQQSNHSLFCWQSDQIVPTIEKNDFKLLIWNIHKGIDEGWESALSTFSQTSDFVLLQEATSKQNLSQLFGESFPIQLSASSFSHMGNQSGVTNLSHYIPKKYCASSQPEPWIRIPKTNIATIYPLPKQQLLLLINVHMINFEWIPDNYTKQLATVFELIKQHQGPIILAGDFNSWNQERIALLNQFVDENQLTALTYPQDLRRTFNGYPLDNVFVRGLTVENVNVIATESSDHNPIIVELKLPQ